MGFFRKKRPPGDTSDVRLDLLIKKIEKFAPKRYRSEREMYYYNYRILGQYVEPLIALLERISEFKRLREEEAVFSRELFFCLKDFYDLKDKLSIQQALEDNNLYRRYVDLFMFFYGKAAPEISELRRWVLPGTGSPDSF